MMNAPSSAIIRESNSVSDHSRRLMDVVRRRDTIRCKGFSFLK